MRDYNNNIYTTQYCRICLCKGNELNIIQCNLLLFYEKIKNIWVQDDTLPQGVCWECVIRLAAFASFYDKVMQSEECLHSMLREDIDVTELWLMAELRRF